MACYTNCPNVELFVNGCSQGSKSVPFAGHAEWPEVVYTPGVVEAKGYRDGQVVAVARVETTGPSSTIRLTPDLARIAAERGDGCVVDVAVVDAQGRVVPDADNEIVFGIEGPGRIIGVGNGHPGSHEADKASHRRAFNGWCQVIVQTAGEIVVTATAAGLVPASVKIAPTR
jgi:beta-galactosidase